MDGRGRSLRAGWAGPAGGVGGACGRGGRRRRPCESGLPPAFRCRAEGREKLPFPGKVAWDGGHSCRPSSAGHLPRGAALLRGLEKLFCSVALARWPLLPPQGRRRGRKPGEPLLLQKQHNTDIFLQRAQYVLLKFWPHNQPSHSVFVGCALMRGDV